MQHLDVVCRHLVIVENMASSRLNLGGAQPLTFASDAYNDSCKSPSYFTVDYYRSYTQMTSVTMSIPSRSAH